MENRIKDLVSIWTLEHEKGHILVSYRKYKQILRMMWPGLCIILDDITREYVLKEEIGLDTEE